MSDEIHINSELALAEHIRKLRKQFAEDHYLIVKMRSGKVRTLTQNAALHLFCEHLADDLNAAGKDFRTTLREGVDVPWSKELVKQYLWKPIQEAVINKQSTAKAERAEYTKVYDVLAHFLATKLNIAAPDWPRKEDRAA